jgi:outer membrane protein TolC
MSAVPQASKVPVATIAAIAAAALLLAGCAGVAPDGGFGTVAAGTRERIGAEPRIARDDAAARALQQEVRAMLAGPLDMDGAVRVALLNHPGLQASYWQVGIAQADLMQASRLRNPGFGFRRVGGGGDIEIERSVTVGLAGALTLPLASRLEARRFEQVKLEVAYAIERHAAQTRGAWVDAVAAGQALDYARRVDAAARASADLAGRMANAGNMNRLELARQQLFQAETAATLARAGRQAVDARERLTRLLGLWGQDTLYTLPAHLPELPAAPAELAEIERIALAQRLDVRAARLDAEASAANLGLTRATRFVNALEIGAAGKSESGQPHERGYELNIELPLFDWGGARNAKAEAIYMQAVNRVAQAAVTARSEARAGYLGYRNAWEVAAHYRDTIIPLRKRISQEVLLRYNGMLASSLELLADSREQASAVSHYIDALKEFWTAHAELEAALGARVGAQPPAPATPAAQEAHGAGTHGTDMHKEHAE